MQLLVIRHGPAEERAEFARTGQPDDLRPLTAQGKKKMAKAARGLMRVVKSIDLLASSRLTRAIETAEIVASACDDLVATEIDELSPDASLETLLAWLKQQRSKDVVAIVGHEPQLSTLVSWLLSKRKASLVEMKKGGAALLTFAGEIAPGAGGFAGCSGRGTCAR